MFFFLVIIADWPLTYPLGEFMTAVSLPETFPVSCIYLFHWLFFSPLWSKDRSFQSLRRQQWRFHLQCAWFQVGLLSQLVCSSQFSALNLVLRLREGVAKTNACVNSATSKVTRFTVADSSCSRKWDLKQHTTQAACFNPEKVRQTPEEHAHCWFYYFCLSIQKN